MAGYRGGVDPLNRFTPSNPPKAKGSRSSGRIMSRILLVIGLLLMLYVVVVVAKALG